MSSEIRLPFEGCPVMTPSGSSYQRPVMLGDREFSNFFNREKELMLTTWTTQDIATDLYRYTQHMSLMQPGDTLVSDMWSGLGWRGKLTQTCITREAANLTEHTLTGVVRAIKATRDKIVKVEDIAEAQDSIDCLREEVCLAAEQLNTTSDKAAVSADPAVEYLLETMPSRYDLIIQKAVDDISDWQAQFHRDFSPFTSESDISHLQDRISDCYHFRSQLATPDWLDYFENDVSVTHARKTRYKLEGYYKLARHYERREQYDRSNYPLSNDIDAMIKSGSKISNLVLRNFAETKTSLKNQMSVAWESE